MPERPDLRRIATSIGDALGDLDREALIDILTFVFKEYVVEGPPPFLVGQVERIPDLEGLSFAELIQALQTRLDVPELGLFKVEGERVSVRIGASWHPLQLATAPEAPVPRAEPPSSGMSAVRVAGASIEQRPQPAPSQPAEAPRPTRGVSIAGRPTGDAGAGAMLGVESRPTAAPAEDAAPAAEQAAPRAKADEDEKKPGDAPDDDDASTRFSLLELD